LKAARSSSPRLDCSQVLQRWDHHIVKQEGWLLAQADVDPGTKASNILQFTKDLSRLGKGFAAPTGLSSKSLSGKQAWGNLERMYFRVIELRLPDPASLLCLIVVGVLATVASTPLLYTAWKWLFQFGKVFVVARLCHWRAFETPIAEYCYKPIRSWQLNAISAMTLCSPLLSCCSTSLVYQYFEITWYRIWTQPAVER
jgi:hypothetical protein